MTSMTMGSEFALQARAAAIQPKPTGRTLARALAAEMGVAWNEMIGRERRREIVRLRQIAQWILIHETKLSLTQIGRLFSRDHSTIIHSRRVIDQESARDPGLATEIEELRERALARWRERGDHAGSLEPLAAPFGVDARKNKLPRAAPKPQSVKPRKCMDRRLSDDERTRLASERLLELLREHHSELELRKTQ